MFHKPVNKYGNKKIEFNGLKFDSKLELYMHNTLNAYGIEFEFQVEIELVPKHRVNGKAIRRTYMKVDFVIKDDNSILYVDTKGFATDVAKLKYKMLGWKKLQEGAEFEIVWLKNKKLVLEFVSNLKKKKDE